MTKLYGKLLVDVQEETNGIEFSGKNNKTSEYKCLPMLKWAGGKRRLLKHLTPLFPKEIKTNYFEPFFGGGALFFATQPANSILSDTNKELIECYSYVKDFPEKIISLLKNMNNSKEDYYKVRSYTPSSGIERAARIIYLTTLSFNGLYRQNLKGEFNVPYGNKEHIIVCDEDRIYKVSQALSNSMLFCDDFENVLSLAEKGDVIYLDPPYAISTGNGFVKYNSKVFTWEDQIRLSEKARELSEMGCKVIISNADVEEIRVLYSDFQCKQLERPSIIAASNEYRKTITECIFYNGVEL